MSGFLLDTNIPSELVRSRPEPLVVRWINSQAEELLFLSAVCIGELRRGFALLPSGKRRDALESWFDDDLVPRFRGRILPVTHAVADRWGVIDAAAQRKGVSLNTADGMIAATALEHDLTLVTRNVKDFARLSVPLYNPWTDT
ncbi:MAG: type II toxin-antitoxin system VapC family toxin [Acidobacteriota bacterium]|nr:type II toxin-antitoxin system VapC family toxin [Acidobacteriota bacterium]